METEEITKLVDGIYKNILDKFNPGARQLIQAGKAYLKALHGAAAASRIYVEAISKLARQAQQGTWGGSSDIGTALTQVVEVYKEIQNQQMNILKAFYVDLLVPLETNLEKDTKVVQSEQKRFLQQHKQRSETYSKAAAAMKKQRKKSKGVAKSGLAMDKELKNMQILEEEKSKLDAFCEQSLKTAMTQERRRYGFVLERQCSLAKHYLAYHSLGGAALQRHLDGWNEVAGTREFLPEAIETVLASRLRQVSFWGDDEAYAMPRSPDVEEDRLSLASQLRKTKSMDASCLDVRCINEVASPLKPLSRAKSDFNLNASTHSLAPEPETPSRPKSMAAPAEPLLARALYAYLSSGDNQLSFLEGDVITLIGERNKGWQFGENLRTQASGWFPLAYTEMLLDDHPSGSPLRAASGDWASSAATTPATPTNGLSAAFAPSPASSSSTASSGGAAGPPQAQPQAHGHGPAKAADAPPPPLPRPASVTMFGDTLLLHRGASRKARVAAASAGVASAHANGPPPMQPAPVPAPRVPPPPSGPGGGGGGGAGAGPGPERRLGARAPPPMPPLPSLLGSSKRAAGAPGAVGSASLHSSNDSGFSNEPPPQPEVDYSDDDSARPASSPAAAHGAANAPTGKKKLLSSVRGWLLYKSALELMDDVNSQQQRLQQRPPPPAGPSPRAKMAAPAPAPARKSGASAAAASASAARPLAMRQASSVGHLATLGRLSLAKDASSSHDALATPPRRAPPDDASLGGGTLVKRSKSLWKFKRSKDDILEGMALWQHRSLIDVNAAVEAEAGVQNGKASSARTTPGGTPTQGSAERGAREAPRAAGQVGSQAPRRARDVDVDDGLLERSLSSAGDSTPDVSDDDGSSEAPDAESCIVVDDHMREASRLRRRRERERERERTDEEEEEADADGGAATTAHTGSLLPRTRLLKPRRHNGADAGRKAPRRKAQQESGSPTSDGAGDGLLQYGRSLQKRLSKPDRGSRFDQHSETTGNRCGPWYDLWGVDPSVKRH